MNSNASKDNINIAMFQRIRSELQCLKGREKNSNIWKKRIRIPMFGRMG